MNIDNSVKCKNIYPNYKDKFLIIEKCINNGIFHEPINYKSKIFLMKFSTVGLYYNHYYAPCYKKKKKDLISLFSKINTFINKTDNIKCIQICDMHQYTFKDGHIGLITYCKKYKINYILTRYRNKKEFKQINNIIKKYKIKTKLITIPLLIDTNIYKSNNLNKKYDILFYGRLSNAYPFRKRIYNILFSKKLNHLNIRILKYGKFRKENLAAEINKSYLCISTCSKFNYLVEKYFEIPASGSLVLGDMPLQGKCIFGENYVSIENNMTDYQIIEKIKNALNDKKKILKKSKKANLIVHTKYSSYKSSLYERLYNIISS